MDTKQQKKIEINQADLKSVVSRIVSMNRMVKKMNALKKLNETLKGGVSKA